jgi:hypothetical protein
MYEQWEQAFLVVIPEFEQGKQETVDSIADLRSRAADDRPGYAHGGIRLMQERLVRSDDRIRGFREHAATAHANAASFRRAARCPWLGAPRVKLDDDEGDNE